MALRLPIYQYWHSEAVPPYITDLTSSFSSHNPTYLHRVFHELEAEGFIREHLSDREAAAFRACATPAMQADYFRYCAVLVSGGIYADADTRCVAPLGALLEPGDAGKLLQYFQVIQESPRRLRVYPLMVNDFFAFRSTGHPLLRLTLDVATANIERRVGKILWFTTGPGIFSLLNLLRTFNSWDSFIECIGHKFHDVSDVLRGVVGDIARVSEAFEDIRIGTVREGDAWMERVESLPYKDPLKLRTSSFRAV